MIARACLVVALAAALTCLAPAPARLQAQTPAADEARLSSLVLASKFTSVKVANPKQPVWTIASRGVTLGDFKVVVTTSKGLLILFVTVQPKANIRRTPELDQKLLKMNHDFDLVKIGYDDDEDAYVRVDSRLRLMDPAEFDVIVEQVRNTAETMYVALKPSLIR